MWIFNQISYNKHYCIYFIANGQNGGLPLNPFGQNPPFQGLCYYTFIFF